MKERYLEQSEWLKTAKLAVQTAAQISLRGYNKPHESVYKEGDELVTALDVQSEQAVRAILKRQYPTHAVIGEEGGRDDVQGSKYTWIIDPIDGTVNYDRAVGPYGISLALAKEKQVIFGIVYNPLTHETFAAERGKGAYLNGKRIHVSNKNVLSQAIIYASSLKRTQQVIAPLFDRVPQLRIATSTAYEMCLIAQGKAEGFIKIDDDPWDYPAGGLIIEEAGGKVTNFDSSPWDITSTHLLMSNGLLHQEMQSNLRR